MRRTKREIQRLRSACTQREVSYADIARLAGVSWRMAYYVITGEKTSAPVGRAFRKLVGRSMEEVIRDAAA